MVDATMVIERCDIAEVSNDARAVIVMDFRAGPPAAPASGIGYIDDTTPDLDATNVQAAIEALLTLIVLVANAAALNLQPTWARGTRYLAAGAATLVLSEAVSTPGVFMLWRGGAVQAPSAYTVNGAGSATIGIPIVTDDGGGGEAFEWIHSGVDPLRVAAARAALGL